MTGEAENRVFTVALAFGDKARLGLTTSFTIAASPEAAVAQCTAAVLQEALANDDPIVAPFLAHHVTEITEGALVGLLEAIRESPRIAPDMVDLTSGKVVSLAAWDDRCPHCGAKSLSGLHHRSCPAFGPQGAA